MPFNIRRGLPEMAAFWRDFSSRKSQGKLDKDEEKFFKKLVKTLGYLAENPRHNSLASHAIDDLTRKYRIKIFQSCLENKTAELNAGRANRGSRFPILPCKTTRRPPGEFSGRSGKC